MGTIDNDEENDTEFDKQRDRMSKRLEEMKKQHERQLLGRKIIKFSPIILTTVVAVGVCGNYYLKSNFSKKKNVSQIEVSIDDNLRQKPNESANAATECTSVEEPSKKYEATILDSTDKFAGDVVSSNGILVNADTMQVLSERNAKEKMYPASMTKVMTVLVAAEALDQKALDDTFEITIDITDYSYSNDCSAAGFSVGENVKIKDLFYGTVLPSGGDAALALATYVAGSHEKFVEMMNKKAKELGISDTTHFTNCVGLYNDEHYSTAYDMAMIMAAAMDNTFCKEVLSTHHYVTQPTTQHPDGIELSNWFLRRIEDKEIGGTVLCGKTGFVVQSGNCAVSYATDKAGTNYIICTGHSSSAWQCIRDQTYLYSHYMNGLALEAANSGSSSKEDMEKKTPVIDQKSN